MSAEDKDNQTDPSSSEGSVAVQESGSGGDSTPPTETIAGTQEPEGASGPVRLTYTGTTTSTAGNLTVVAPTPSDRIDPESGEVTLSDGTVVDVLPLKTREFLKMMRILTRGGSNVLGTMVLRFDGDVQQFATQLSAMVLFAVPEAEDETIEFLRSMVRPKGVKDPKDPASAALDVLLQDPEIDDTITIVEAVIRREASDLKALGRRLRQMFEVARKVGEVPSEMVTEE